MNRSMCTDLRTKAERPVCEVCNKAFAAKSGDAVSPGIYKYYLKDCRGCRNERLHGKRHTDIDSEIGRNSARWRNRKYRRPHLVHRKDFCEVCGFKAKHECQLDVDHIDGNHKNNDVSNLKTLCANCHRLKSYTNRDYWKNN